MKRLYLLPLFISFLAVGTIYSKAYAQTITWQKTIGGDGRDTLTAASIGSNQTFVMCGASLSGISGNKSDANAGGWDYWVVKMDFSGNIIWNKTFGGSKNDVATAIITTADGGYLVGGTSISDKTGSKSAASNKQSSDYWVIKLDANGNKIWDKTLGGIFTDKLTSLAQLPNGNYVAGGYSFSAIGGTKTVANIGSENTADFWILVLAPDGSILSQNVYGGGSYDIVSCIAPVANNDFFALGYSYSLKQAGRKTILPVGNNDYWFVRTNQSGAIKYEGNFGGDRSEFLTAVQLLADSSLIIGGYSNSSVSGAKSGSFMGVTDYWLVKTNPDKSKQWDKTIGGTGGDYLTSVQQTQDNGFLLGGYSNSNKGNSKTENSKGGFDYWIVKTNSTGDILWNRTLGGTGNDHLSGVYEIAPNQFIAVGTSSSPKSGNKSSGTIGTNGSSDFWVLRLNYSASLVNDTPAPSFDSFAAHGFQMHVAPNPVAAVLTIRYATADAAQAHLVLYDANGVAVRQAVLPLAPDGAMYKLNVSPLASGVYQAVMYAGKGKEVVRQKIIKQ